MIYFDQKVTCLGSQWCSQLFLLIPRASWDCLSRCRAYCCDAGCRMLTALPGGPQVEMLQLATMEEDIEDAELSLCAYVDSLNTSNAQQQGFSGCGFYLPLSALSPAPYVSQWSATASQKV